MEDTWAVGGVGVSAMCLSSYGPWQERVPAVGQELEGYHSGHHAADTSKYAWHALCVAHKFRTMTLCQVPFLLLPCIVACN